MTRNLEEDLRHEIVNGLLLIYVYLTKIQISKTSPDDIRLYADTAIFKCKKLVEFIDGWCSKAEICMNCDKAKLSD